MEEISIDIFNLLDSQPEPARGNVLIAKPTVDDECFKRSVILLVDHDSEGSMGVMVNHLTDYTLADVLDGPEFFSQIPIYLGGPVGLNQLFFLHTLGPEVIPGCLQVAKGVYFGGDYEAIKRYVRCGEPTDGKLKFIIGYSGWEAGQLASEIARHDWVIQKQIDPTLLLQEMEEEMWKAAAESFGDKYRTWNNWPTNPSDN
ncbi:MAG: YqgE/AlgH family protein [Bacteroidales bacterium]|nr:YqgE/AlgH family protein [Bacteroidales bacterium]